MTVDPHTDPFEPDEVLRRLVGPTRALSFGPYFADRVVERIARPAPRPVAVRWIRPGLLRPALALGTVAAALVVWSLLRMHSASAPIGGSTETRLADGSVVALASGSELRWRSFAFSRERNVTLRGEAFFDVEPGGAPFVVSTFDATVTVTGTRFNVRAWPDAEVAATEVALVEGSVVLASAPRAGSIATAFAPTAVALRAGETARSGGAGAPVRLEGAPDPEGAASWRTGGIVFSNRPLADVLHDLERRFGVRIEAAPDVTRGRSATYMNPGRPRVEDVLDAISFALGLRYGRMAGGWRLVAGDFPNQMP